MNALAGIPDDVLKEFAQLVEAKGREETREKATDDFMAFAHHVYDNFIEGTHHRIIAEKLEAVARGELKRLIINMPPRHPLRLNTPVLTTSGWKTIGTVKAGDYVYTPGGEPVRVTGKSPVYHRQIYEVETTDGHVVECDGGHLWSASYSTRGNPRFDGSFRDMTTEEIFQRGTPKRGGPYLPHFSAVKGEEKDLPIDPYVLGVWLGDGTKYGASLGCATSDEPEMRSLIEAQGYKTSDRDGYQMFGVLGLHEQLRNAGLLQNKHIPDIYFTASVQQREALLQGLMDTDGSVGKTGRCTFHQTDEHLTSQVCALINGLGVRARITTRQTSYDGVPSQPSHRINFRYPRAARLSRKACRLGELSRLPGRAIKVRKTDRFDDVQCISVENDDGLFLVGHGMVVTHNSKSELSSYLMPAWFLGRNPKLKIIQATHTGDLAVRFGRKVRDLIADPHYQEIFSDTHLKADAKAAGKWETSKGGEYFAAGVGGAVTGRGADLFIIDDPHSEQDAMSPDGKAFDDAYEWYTSGPRQRLQPGGAIIIVMTRWGKKDLTGRLLQDQTKDPLADQWDVIEFPAILPSETPLWPQFWHIDALKSVKAALPVHKWNAQWQQKPTAQEGAIIKKEWWKDWDKEHVPDISYIIQAYDTAFSKKESADFSAITTWGVFLPEEGGEPAIILLDARRERWSFPELKKNAMAEYDYWEPDLVIIEGKASGIPLSDEMRLAGVPTLLFSPGKGTEKHTRMHLVAPLFEAGMVWAPKNKKFAEELIEEANDFPNGDNDDLCDSMVLALMRFRKGGFVRLPSDEKDEDEEYRPHARRKRSYY